MEGAGGGTVPRNKQGRNKDDLQSKKESSSIYSQEKVSYDFGQLPARILRNRNENSRAGRRASEYAEKPSLLDDSSVIERSRDIPDSQPIAGGLAAAVS